MRGRCSKVASCGKSQCICKTDVGDGGTIVARCEFPGGKGGCLSHNAMELAVKSEKKDFLVDIPIFRHFDNKYLATHTLGREYLEFIPVLDRNLRLDLEALDTYMDVFPDLYQMMNSLTDERFGPETIVVTEDLHRKALEILDQYEYVDDLEFQSMRARMTSDLEITSGMTKAELQDWIDSY